MFNFSAENERKLSIGKMKIKIYANFFNLTPEMESNVSISGSAITMPQA